MTEDRMKKLMFAVVGAAPAVESALPEGWRIAWVGSTLKAIAGRGTLVIVK